MNTSETESESLVCKFGWNKARAVIVDGTRAKIQFHRSHVPRRFLGFREKSFSCAASDLHSIHELHNRGSLIGLTVVTTFGNAWIPANATNFSEMRTTLHELVPANKDGLATSNPMMWLGLPAAGISGCLAGWALTPDRASDGLLAVMVLSGALLGVAILWLTVWAGERFFSVSLAVPFGYCTPGLFIGMLIYSLLDSVVGRHFDVFWPSLLIGAVGGFIYGLRKQSRGERRYAT